MQGVFLLAACTSSPPFCLFAFSFYEWNPAMGKIGVFSSFLGGNGVQQRYLRHSAYDFRQFVRDGRRDSGRRTDRHFDRGLYGKVLPKVCL
jgi:hypothetical protein